MGKQKKTKKKLKAKHPLTHVRVHTLKCQIRADQFDLAIFRFLNENFVKEKLIVCS